MKPDLAKRAADMLDEILAAEFDDRCPVCEAFDDHSGGCELGEILAELREVEKVSKASVRAADNRLGRNLTDLLATMGPAARRAKPIDRTGEPPAWLDEDAALHRTDRRVFPRAPSSVVDLSRTAEGKLAAIENFVVDELDGIEAVGGELADGEAARVLTEIREILDGTVKP